MKKALIMALLIAFIFSACGSTEVASHDEPEPLQEETIPLEPETENEDSGEDSVIVGNTIYAGLVWIVEPVFTYDDIICIDEEGIIARGNGIYIDQKTGKPAGQVYGHGIGAICLYYDEMKDLYGIFYHGDGASEIAFYSEKEFESQHFWLYENREWVEKPYIDTVQIIYSIDSTKIDKNIINNYTWYEEYGSELESIRGQGAVAYGKNFVTDFEYDDGEHIGTRYVNSNIAVQNNGKWGIVDRNGETVAPFVFDEAITIDDDTAFAKYEGKVGILNLSPDSPIGIVNTPGGVLDIRKAPALPGEIIGTLEDKTKTVIRKEIDGFYMISYKGSEAYISMDSVIIIS